MADEKITPDIPTLYAWAGGMPAFEHLTAVFYKKVLQDTLLEPVFKHMSAQHQLHVAHFIAEVFGGPQTYSSTEGSHFEMIRKHLGRHLTEAQRKRWVELLLRSADEINLPDDPEFRSAFVAYIEWGTRIAVLNSRETTPGLAPHEPMPKWDWGVPGGPFQKIGVWLFCLFLLQSGALAAAVYPTLPQVYMQTEYNPPVGGQLFTVSTGAAFQSALNAAQLGDIIELPAGVTFTGPFSLPKKTDGAGWIYVRSAAYVSLPSPCSRVSISDAVNMPKIVVAAGSGGAIQTVAGAHHFRFVGIEFRPVAGNFVYNIVQIGNGETTAANLPHDLVFDRCYIHGDPVAGSRRGVLMNGASVAVIDSYVSDCKEDGADSQALAAYSTTGPLKIVNNYLEGAGENVIFGGADPSIPLAVPSDIEIRYNLFFKPLAWMNQLWDIKNLLEFKNAQRVLVEGNRLENCWPNAQSGFALLLTPRNQNNTAPWSVVQDITIRFNTFVNIAQGVNMSGYDAPNISQRTSRVLIQNNVLNVTNLGMGGDGRLFQVLNGPTDVIFDHNTGFCTNAYMVSDGSPKTDFFVFQNNIVSHANYGFIGSGTAYANTTLAMYFNPNWVVTKNVDIGGSATNYPAGSYFPANTAAVGFVNYAAGDYHLLASSPYKQLGTDGKDLGANIDSIVIASTYNCLGASAVQESDPVAPRFALSPNYPNPFTESTTLDYYLPVSGLVKLSVRDVMGRERVVLVEAPMTAGRHTLKFEAGDFSPGVYFCCLTAGNCRLAQKLIILR